MSSRETRQKFLDFFQSKGHVIVDSAPLVMRNDPSLLFTNAGMNQFKDIFLGTTKATYQRVCDTQKCLRVSGKHNDLDEVGFDTYHHTFFEMLGNWSFGDYFKKEAIDWAWELLTKAYKFKPEDLYVTVFKGDKLNKLEKDRESEAIWKQHVNEDHILYGEAKDNFWEMGETGPCGPCSEIHIDLRNANQKAIVQGCDLVNTGHPQVIELWNLVFIQFNRMLNGSLENLPQKHVDTGMGFERLCMAIQGKQSNYDTDVFLPLLDHIATSLDIPYGAGEKTDIAMRVLADHARAVVFAIADGQLPSNTGAGYVIRRILRRAVRYGYTYLSIREPFLFTLTPVLATQFSGVFESVSAQQTFIAKVINEEEQSFLHTLESGISRFEKYAAHKAHIAGEFAFELYDTYGFPVDLTMLMAREKGIPVEMEVFEALLEKQKVRARNAGTIEAGDWTILHEEENSIFTGYEEHSSKARLLRYREVFQKSEKNFQLVFDRTPFYAEGGGQVGDTGWLTTQAEKINIINTVKENETVLHITRNLPYDMSLEITLKTNVARRKKIEANHSATHLLQAALKQVLGGHVQQRGSRVDDEGLRFDFSHFTKMSEVEIQKTEELVNEKIRANIQLRENLNVPYKAAVEEGATALFGEKYGDFVRVITFEQGFSSELCGGTHVRATGSIGLIKLVSESAVAAGVRRIEALTGEGALKWLTDQVNLISTLKTVLKTTSDPVKAVQLLQAEHAGLKKEIETFEIAQARQEKEALKALIDKLSPVAVVVRETQIQSQELIKSISFELKNEFPNLVLILGGIINEKPFLSIAVSDQLVSINHFNAAIWIRQIAKHIEGGGGGQPFYATAGGKSAGGLKKALDQAHNLVTPINTD